MAFLAGKVKKWARVKGEGKGARRPWGTVGDPCGQHTCPLAAKLVDSTVHSLISAHCHHRSGGAWDWSRVGRNNHQTRFLTQGGDERVTDAIAPGQTPPTPTPTSRLIHSLINPLPPPLHAPNPLPKSSVVCATFFFRRHQPMMLWD